MSIKKRKIEKEIEFFNCSIIDGKTIDELISFIQNSKTTLLIQSINIVFQDKNPVSLEIYVNPNGVEQKIEIKPEMFYYFKNSQLETIKTPEDITFW